jgi:hypothetical protein
MNSASACSCNPRDQFNIDRSHDQICKRFRHRTVKDFETVEQKTRKTFQENCTSSFLRHLLTLRSLKGGEGSSDICFFKFDYSTNLSYFTGNCFKIAGFVQGSASGGSNVFLK